MLGCAFYVAGFFALCGAVSVYVPLVIAVLWVAKMIFIAFVEAEEANKKAEAKGLMQFGIYSGVETFSPKPLAKGMRCKVLVQGIDRYRYYEGKPQTMLDAAYLIRGGEYSRHQSFLLDGCPVAPFQEDLHHHHYSFPCVGTGRQLSVFLRLPQGIHADADNPQRMTVTIRTLTAAEEVEVKALEEKWQREAAQMQQEELRRQALELAMLARVENNFLSLEYQQNYAAKHTAAILKTLGQQWRDEYLKLMSNEPLSARVQADCPEILDIFEARLRVITIAQKLAVEPTPPPAPEPTSRLTPEEWAARIERYRQRSLTRKRVKFEDHRADVLQDLEMLQDFIADLDNYPSLDEDERERLITEFKERLLGGEEEDNNGFRQL